MASLIRVAFFGWLLSAGTTFAQTPPFLVGTWKVTWQGDAALREGRLVVKEAGGTWQSTSVSRRNPCVGREVPIAVESIDADSAKVLLKYSESLNGCADTSLLLKRGQPNTLTGMRGDAPLTAVRE